MNYGVLLLCAVLAALSATGAYFLGRYLIGPRD
jgi:hypothetical protein